MTDALKQAAQKLDAFLAQFNVDEQERIIRYALDHVVPKMKRAALAAPEQRIHAGGGAVQADTQNVCQRCCKWAGAHAILPGQPRDHLCHCAPQPAAPAQALALEVLDKAEAVCWELIARGDMATGNDMAPLKTLRTELECYGPTLSAIEINGLGVKKPVLGPPQSARQALTEIASEVVQSNPLAPFDGLREASHIGHLQFARAYSQANEALRALAARMAKILRESYAAPQPAAPAQAAQINTGKTMNQADQDNAAVDAFAAEMKAKLAAAREKGRGGWQTADQATLSRMLREHVSKGDPRDVANFCMFLHHLGWGIAANQAATERSDT